MNGPSSSPQRAHPSSIGWKPSSESSFQKNAALTSGDGCSASVRSAPDEHAVERGVGLALLGDLVDGLEHRHRVGEAAVVLAQRAVGVDGLDLGDDVELAAPVALQRDVARRLEPGPEAAPGLAHALGHRPDLAVSLGEDGDDPVGLPELDRAQHDPLVPVQVHYISVILPRRRTSVEHRRSGVDCRMFDWVGHVVDGAEAAFAALELGDRVEEVRAAEVGPEHVGEHELGVGGLPERKFEIRCSPDGAHEQVGVGQVGGVEVAGDDVLVDRRPRIVPGLHLAPRWRRRRRRQLGPPAVVDGEGQGHPVGSRP